MLSYYAYIFSNFWAVEKFVFLLPWERNPVPAFWFKIHILMVLINSALKKNKNKIYTYIKNH